LVSRESFFPFSNLRFEMGWWRKKKKPKSEIASERGAKLLKDLIECCDGKSNPIKFFSADEIRKATNNFGVSNLVSELSHDFDYKWYSGKNENHDMILVRKAFSQSVYYKDTFFRDIAVSSMVSGHKNFLKLIGYCLEFEEPVMVYHGVKKHYHLESSEQPWKRRMKIAEDIATALAYLHTAFPRPFVYRCLSLTNILLDEDGVAKLMDFSFCVSIPEGETFVQVDYIAGTVDYLKPNYLKHGVVSEETDVFAVGHSMQMLLMGEKIFDRIMRRPFPTSKFMEEPKMDEIADPEMGEISEEELCQMKAFLLLSLRCTGHVGEVPTMVEVAKELKSIQRCLHNDTFSPSVETQFDSHQDISSSVILSNQTKDTRALLRCIACHVFDEMFQWVMMNWFRFFRRNRRIC